MGEPLLYSYFEDLLDFCKSRDIKINLTTNGTFPNKWNSERGMNALLSACSDIKISSLAYEMGGFSQMQWRQNLEQLLNCRHQMNRAGTLATISLQVTLHRENINQVEEILHYAEDNSINRIKWNPVVFLDNAPQEMRSRYELDKDSLKKLQQEFRQGNFLSTKVQNEGSLFFEHSSNECPMAKDCSECPFTDEIWIWPDGHEDHCPNPKRRWK
jgi:wyosine [tRNA(Phe)-imidazoG37] synthetase (radical SAM superfamily)